MPVTPETAEFIRQDSIKNEIHGVSLRATRQLGHLANLLADRDLREHQVYDQAKGEFESRIFEGLSTDEEHGEKLRVTKFGSLPVMGGRVMTADKDGWVSITEILQNGLDSAEAEAWQDPKKWTHFNRALNDIYNGSEVDEMVAGNRDYNTRLVVSCDPVAAINKDGADHWAEEGYVEDLCYLQFYHHSDDELLTGSLSFYAKDKSVVRDVFAQYGVEIPAEAPIDDYIKYAATANFDTEEGAKEFAQSVRNACDRSTGVQKPDTVDGLQANQPMIDSIFDEMHVPASQSLGAKKKNDRTHDIAQSFLDNSSHFSPELRQGLLKICNSDSFDDDDMRLMQKLIDYSAIEKLRLAIKEDEAGVDALDWTVATSTHDLSGLLFEMSRLAASGARMGRSYSSCGGGIKVAADKIPGELEENSQQAYGGKTCNKEVKNGDSVKCPHCAKRVRAIVRNKGKIECSNGGCSKAAASVKSKAV
jgi:hypothetical protein